MNKIFHYIKKLPFIKEDNALAQLIRTYIVGGVNLLIGLLFNYIFQFFIFNNIGFGINKFIKESDNFSFIDLIFSKEIYLPILVFLVFILMSLVIKKKFFNKKR